jgi:hypothetical protein
MYVIHFYFNTSPHMQFYFRCKRGICVGYNLFYLFFNKSHRSRFKLETSASDNILNYYVPTSSSKSLS